MNRWIISSFVATFLLLLSCTSLETETETTAPSISIQGSTLSYEGELNTSAVRNAIDLAETADAPVTTLSINSPGGDINAGMLLGLWVHENGSDVVVEGACFSSCANYIFTAGKNVLVKSGAVVGWHGGANQSDLAWEKSLKRIPRKERKEVEVQLKAQQKQEIEFFSTIGVDPKITTYGQLKKISCRSKDNHGWYYKLSDLEHMGVTSITLEDGKFATSTKKAENVVCEMPLLFPVASTGGTQP